MLQQILLVSFPALSTPRLFLYLYFIVFPKAPQVVCERRTYTA